MFFGLFKKKQVTIEEAFKGAFDILNYKNSTLPIPEPPKPIKTYQEWKLDFFNLVVESIKFDILNKCVSDSPYKNGMVYFNFNSKTNPIEVGFKDFRFTKQFFNELLEYLISRKDFEKFNIEYTFSFSDWSEPSDILNDVIYYGIQLRVHYQINVFDRFSECSAIKNDKHLSWNPDNKHNYKFVLGKPPSQYFDEMNKDN